MSTQLLIIGIPMILVLGIFVRIITSYFRQIIARWGTFDANRRRYALTVMVCLVIFIGGLANFASFWIISGAIGGDATSGHIANGRYFVGSHGKYTEVPHAVWIYSWYHGWSTYFTHALVALAFLIMTFAKRMFGLEGELEMQNEEDGA